MSELHCSNHPDRTALETCEVCGKPLCGYCLYYTEDGQRLCEQHAHSAKQNGLVIIPPAVYADGIIPAQAQAQRVSNDEVPKGSVSKNRPLYQGNNVDLNAFLGMGIGILMLASCCGASGCLPFIAVILGVAALYNAKDAVDPRRTRQHGVIAILTGGIFVAGIAACVGCYVLLIAGTARISTNSFGVGATYWIFPSSTVTVAPFSTNTPEPSPLGLEPSQATATVKALVNKKVTPTPVATIPPTLEDDEEAR